MSAHTVSIETIEGSRHKLDDDEYVFIAPGFCYMKSPVGTSGSLFFHSISPTDAQAIINEEPHTVDENYEETIYETNRMLYVAGDRPVGVDMVVDYLIDDVVYTFDGEYPIGNGWVHLVNGWSNVEDKFLEREVFENGIEDGDITTLCPIWKKAHR